MELNLKIPEGTGPLLTRLIKLTEISKSAAVSGNVVIVKASQANIDRLWEEKGTEILAEIVGSGLVVEATLAKSGEKFYVSTDGPEFDQLRDEGNVVFELQEFMRMKPGEFRATYDAKDLFKARAVEAPEHDPFPVRGLPPRKPLSPVAVKALMGHKQAISKCQLCGLANTRKNTVPGEGYMAPHILFVGEGPGENEDLTGKPFVGRAGGLLDELITHAGISRQEVFVTNIVKCRPPNNRDPLGDEVGQCSAFLHGQIEALDPTLIVCLGKNALQWFFPDVTSIGSHRGRVRAWESATRAYAIYPTYHPSAGLRNIGFKGTLFDDFEKIPGITKTLWDGFQQELARLRG